MIYKQLVDYFLCQHSPLKEVALTLRDLIKAASREVDEQLKWRVPTYSINKNICSIIVHKHHVNLQLMQGAVLEDSDLLEGSGKHMRHMKFKQVDDIKKGVVTKLLKQAIDQDQ